jgi:hypothetical protein
MGKHHSGDGGRQWSAMADCFVSYSREDHALAEALVADLKAREFSV